MALVHFLSGAVAFGFMTSALFFWRFWQRSGDSLFLNFGMAFALLGLAQAIIGFGGFDIEEQKWAYVVRLTAFLLILFAIIRKNRHA